MFKFKVSSSNRLLFVCLIVLSLAVSFVVVRGADLNNRQQQQEDDLIEGENRRLGVTVKKSLSDKRETSDDLESIEESMASIDSELNRGGGGGGEVKSVEVTTMYPIENLISKQGALFQQDALPQENLAQMDCHMRNIDYCYAGLLSASAHMIPENDHEFEVRCDELKAASSCVAVYNQRCSTMKVFSAFAPLLGNDDDNAIPQELRDMPLPPAFEDVIENKDGQQQANNIEIKTLDLVNICNPSAKNTRANKLLRQRLYQIGKCVNQRLPQISPCIEDLKTALQLFYEPTRSLPLRPTCCAFTRFRLCSMNALDNVCGLSSLNEFEKSLNSFSSGKVFKSLDRICKQLASKMSDIGSYCSEVLPPSGMKIAQRTGRKASKLARALNMIQFAPQGGGSSTSSSSQA